MKIISDIIANFIRVLFESRTSCDRNDRCIRIRIINVEINLQNRSQTLSMYIRANTN